MKKLLLVLLLGMFMISFSSATLTDDIISYYKLDNTTGVVFDMLGLNDGTNDGATRGVTGKINNAFDFDGINDNVNISAGINLSNKNFTISLWIANTYSLTTKTKFIIGQGSPSANQAIFISRDKNTGKVNFGFISDDLSSSTNLSTDGSFEHWVFTYDASTNNKSIYFNGSLDSDDISSADTSAIGEFIIGDWLGTVDETFEGRLDEIGIWNRSLSSSEVSQLYNSGVGLSFPFPETDLLVTLNSPLNNTIISSNVTFNSTLIPVSGFNLTNATLFIWDSNGDLFFTDTNIVTGNTSTQTSFLVTNLTSGNYEWNVLGSSENLTGFLSANFSSNNNTFTWVPFSVDNEVFQSNVFETSKQDFLLNISTLPSVLSVNAILNYNGTRFTADTSCLSGSCQIGTSIDIPLISTGQTQNKSFLWEISIFDGTNSFSINLTSSQQNVTRLNLEDCNGTFTMQTLNFTSFD